VEDIPYQTDEMSNVNSEIEVEQISRLCDDLPHTGEEVDEEETEEEDEEANEVESSESSDDEFNA
jgi:hypothetical protein